MELTRRLLSPRYSSGCGAQDLVDFGHMGSYYPGFVDDARKKDTLPSLDELLQAGDDYKHVCRAGGLRTVDDEAWWKRADCRAQDPAAIVRAAEAAEWLIRSPQCLIGSTHSCHLEPQPAADIVDLVGGLNHLANILADVVKRADADIRRRRGRLIYDFALIYGKAGLTQEEQQLLHEYEYEMARERRNH